MSSLIVTPNKHNLIIRFALIPYLHLKEIGKIGLISTAFNKSVDGNKYLPPNQDKSIHFEYIVCQHNKINMDLIVQIKE